MKKEHILVIVAGLFILAYVLDRAVKPLALSITSPYEFLQSQYVSQYPLTTVSIFIKSIGIFLGVLFVSSLLKGRFSFKGITLLVIASLMQFFAFQNIATGDNYVATEWSIAISLAGISLALPILVYFIRGFFASVHQSLTEGKVDSPEEQEEN